MTTKIQTKEQQKRECIARIEEHSGSDDPAVMLLRRFYEGWLIELNDKLATLKAKQKVKSYSWSARNAK